MAKKATTAKARTTRIAEATGTASAGGGGGTGGGAGGGGVAIQAAMAKAVEECARKGITDPEEVLAAKLAARAKLRG